MLDRPDGIVLLYESREAWAARNPELSQIGIDRFLAPEGEVEKISNSLQAVGYDVIEIDYDKSKDFIADFIQNKPYFIWNLTDGMNPFIGSIAPFLSEFYAGSRYIGSSTYTQGLAQIKPHWKSLVRSIGLDTPDWRSFYRNARNDFRSLNSLGGPLFVKPANMGNSIGLDLIDPISQSATDAHRKVTTLLDAGFDHVMAEKFIDGAEITIAGIHDKKWKFFSFEQVYEGAYIAPDSKDNYAQRRTQLSIKTTHKMRHLMNSIIQALGVNDYVRVDMRRKDDKLMIIDINVCTFLTTITFSNVAKKYASFQHMLDVIVKNAYQRQVRGTSRPPTPISTEKS